MKKKRNKRSLVAKKRKARVMVEEILVLEIPEITSVPTGTIGGVCKDCAAKIKVITSKKQFYKLFGHPVRPKKKQRKSSGRKG